MKRARLVTCAARVAFVCFALALHTATHWPQLALVEAPFSWFDKVVHACSFFTWTGLLIISAVFGPAISSRNLLWCLVLGLAVGGLDEATQGIPWVRRDPSWADFAADAFGVLVACSAALASRRWIAQIDGPAVANRK